MNKKRSVFGTHAFFFPDGVAYTVPGAGTCGRAAKPGAADPAWFDLGVSTWGKQPTHKIEDFDAPAPGRRQLYDKITTRVGLTLKGKMMEISNVMYQMMLATAQLGLTGAGGQYNPLEGDPVVRGWLQLQEYNQENVLINTTDYFVAMTIPGDVTFDDKLLDIDVEAAVLFSTLNTGTLA